MCERASGAGAFTSNDTLPRAPHQAPPSERQVRPPRPRRHSISIVLRPSPDGNVFAADTSVPPVRKMPGVDLDLELQDTCSVMTERVAAHVPMAPPAVDTELHGLSRIIMRDAKSIHRERASVQARVAGEVENNTQLILAEVRTDILAATRKFCHARRALKTLQGKLVKNGRWQQFVREKVLPKKRVVVGFRDLLNLTRTHGGPASMWGMLADEVGLDSISPAGFRGNAKHFPFHKDCVSNYALARLAAAR